MLLLFSDRITTRRKIGYLGAVFMVVGVVLASIGAVPGVNLVPWAWTCLTTGISLVVLASSPEKTLVFAKNRILNALLIASVVPIVLITLGILIGDMVGHNLEGSYRNLTFVAPISIVTTFWGAICLTGARSSSAR